MTAKRKRQERQKEKMKVSLAIPLPKRPGAGNRVVEGITIPSPPKAIDRRRIESKDVLTINSTT